MSEVLPPDVAHPLMLHGDCLDLLEQLPAASVDVVVTDPPAGIGFMAKPWDSFKTYKPRTGPGRDIKGRLDGLLADWAVGFVTFMVDVWTEVDRVLKPGGFVCAWALPKTADLAGLALRAVGWEMHDSLLHLFGGGFPKGSNIGKDIDKVHGAERAVVGQTSTNRNRPATAKWAKSLTSAGSTVFSDGLGAMLKDVTAPATDDARRWDGWHSQLAPGHEHWLLARKPTRLTYARQVLTHCTGGLHVDACRVPRGESTSRPNGKVRSLDVYGAMTGGGVSDSNPGGSWPRNVLLTCGGEDCPAEALDRQGVAMGCHSAGSKQPPQAKWSEQSNTTYGGGVGSGPNSARHGDAGGASRFFTRFDDRVWYGGKAHRRDIPGTSRRISHPTHKNPELMRWLVRLLAATCEQTGGEPAIVLDPFGGSFTTAWACVAERVRCITIERDLDSFEQGRARVLSALGSPELAAGANTNQPAGGQLAML